MQSWLVRLGFFCIHHRLSILSWSCEQAVATTPQQKLCLGETAELIQLRSRHKYVIHPLTTVWTAYFETALIWKCVTTSVLITATTNCWNSSLAVANMSYTEKRGHYNTFFCKTKSCELSACQNIKVYTLYLQTRIQRHLKHWREFTRTHKPHTSIGCVSQLKATQCSTRGVSDRNIASSKGFHIDFEHTLLLLRGFLLSNFEDAIQLLLEQIHKSSLGVVGLFAFALLPHFICCLEVGRLW